METVAAMDNSVCPVCVGMLDPRKGVVSTSHGWMHPDCEKKYSAAKAKFVDSLTAQQTAHQSPREVLPPKDVLEDIAARAERMLLGEYMPGESQADWAKRKGADVAMVLGANFRIERRR